MLNWHKKEKPLQGMGGLGGGVVSRLMGGGALAPISATGGDSTLDITGYKVHIFTSTGPATFQVDSGGGDVEYLVVAGGGSGSAQYGGGGGAGGLRTNLSGHPRAGNPFPVTPEPYAVTVGAGGQYATPPAMPGVAGGDSSFGSITATGGGGGGAPGQEPNPWGSSTNGGLWWFWWRWCW